MKNIKPEGHEYSNDCTCPYCGEIRQRFNKLMGMFAEHNIRTLTVDVENQPNWGDKVAGRVYKEAINIIGKRNEHPQP